jgi:diguanylate cyclase (GGDEF)-like protein/PAS domain S-box-containing protein
MDAVGVAEAGARSPWWYHPAFEGLTDFVVVLRPDGTILYANPFVERLLGIAVDDGLGSSIAEFLHPDDLERAAEVVGLMADDSMGVAITPAVYRIRTSDASWRPVELNATLHDGPEGDQVVIVVGRYSGDRALLDEILELLTAGASPAEVVALVPRFGTWRHPEDHYAVVYTDDDGERVTVGSPATVRLTGLEEPNTPWQQACDTREEVVCTLDDLPPVLRRAALERGLDTCWAVPVDDPLFAHPAVIVVWSRSEIGGREVHRYALQTMARALTLVLQWRQQVTSLRLAARRDPLTGLANRTSFFELLDGLARRSTGARVGVLYIDLDGFKAVNDEHGHLVGDDVLVEAAERLARVLRPADVVARLGGDEFAVLCEELASDDDASAIADRIVAAFTEPFVIGSLEVRIGASVGIATVTERELDGELLLDSADQALYEAKNAGRGRWQLATSD